MVPKQVAFTCRICHNDIGDPLYTGPRGHCTPDVCAECWAHQWVLSTRRHLPIGVQFLLENYGRGEIVAMGVSRRELQHQLDGLSPSDIPAASCPPDRKRARQLRAARRRPHPSTTEAPPASHKYPISDAPTDKPVLAKVGPAGVQAHGILLTTPIGTNSTQAA